jgi:uncharacterized small protein (DUF1192 family)
MLRLATASGHSRPRSFVLTRFLFLSANRATLENVTGGQRMASEDDDKPRKKITHEIGQDLSLLSVEELNERIALMSSEIERLQQAATKKRASKDAANSFFKS